MAKACVICQDARREAIERDIESGMSLVLLAERLGTNDDVLMKHRKKHMSNGEMTVKVEFDALAIMNGLVETVQMCDEWNKISLGFNPTTGVRDLPMDPKGGVAALRERRGCFDQMAKIKGLYDQLDPSFMRSYMNQMTDAVLHALAAHPEAKKAVQKAISGVEGREDEDG